MVGLQYMRRFEGEKYFLKTSCKTKGKAQEIAERIRDVGLKARVIRQSAGGYAVYGTGKHK